MLPTLGLWAFYCLCPALLAAAYWFDLFMTVHAAPFLPIILAACLHEARDPHPANDACLAAGLAAVWLAHPPVALWMSTCALVARLAIFLCWPTWRELLQLTLTGLLVLLLSDFLYASVKTLGALGSFTPESLLPFREQIWSMIKLDFPGSLLPAPNSNNYMSNLQLSYAPRLACADWPEHCGVTGQS